MLPCNQEVEINHFIDKNFIYCQKGVLWIYSRLLVEFMSQQS